MLIPFKPEQVCGTKPFHSCLQRIGFTTGDEPFDVCLETFRVTLEQERRLFRLGLAAWSK
jgi:hypothetical protein